MTTNGYHHVQDGTRLRIVSEPDEVTPLDPDRLALRHVGPAHTLHGALVRAFFVVLQVLPEAR